MTYYRFASNLLGDYLVCNKIGQFEKDHILTSYEGGISPLTIVGHIMDNIRSSPMLVYLNKGKSPGPVYDCIDSYISELAHSLRNVKAKTCLHTHASISQSSVRPEPGVHFSCEKAVANRRKKGTKKGLSVPKAG